MAATVCAAVIGNDWLCNDELWCWTSNREAARNAMRLRDLRLGLSTGVGGGMGEWTINIHPG